MKRLASVLGDRSALGWARHHHGVQSGEVSMAWARRTNDNYREVTTTTGAGDRRRRGARWGVGIDDNYGGGDDNYPRVVVKMGAEGREEGRGRNRQK